MNNSVGSASPRQNTPLLASPPPLSRATRKLPLAQPIGWYALQVATRAA
ncbi:MAG: hypothetical protein HC893_15205 [Chloroflexaceae bacterium]|nr:hypothetical protein [Chloroflexaceae bacterium]